MVNFNEQIQRRSVEHVICQLFYHEHLEPCTLACIYQDCLASMFCRGVTVQISHCSDFITVLVRSSMCYG